MNYLLRAGGINGRVFNRHRHDLDHARSSKLPFNTGRNHVAIARKTPKGCRRAIHDGQCDRRMFGEPVIAVESGIDFALPEGAPRALVMGIHPVTVMRGRARTNKRRAALPIPDLTGFPGLRPAAFHL